MDDVTRTIVRCMEIVLVIFVVRCILTILVEAFFVLRRRKLKKVVDTFPEHS